MNNVASGRHAFIGDGQNCHAVGPHTVAFVGENSFVDGAGASLVTGFASASIGLAATVAGGCIHDAVGDGSTVRGGFLNGAARFATVGGGAYCFAVGYYATISGGGEYKVGGNYAGGRGSTVGGGDYSSATGDYSTVAGGHFNSAYGAASVVPGGRSNRTLDHDSFAAGRSALAADRGAFVWSDSQPAQRGSSANDQFNVFARGGTRCFSDAAATTGVALAPGAGTWTTVSDRELKQDVRPVDEADVLARVAALPLSTWRYRDQDPAVRHMGPTAQDFHRALGLGIGPTTLDGVDADGAVLASVRALHARDAVLAARVAAKDAEIEELRRELEAVRAALGAARPPSSPGGKR